MQRIVTFDLSFWHCSNDKRLSPVLHTYAFVKALVLCTFCVSVSNELFQQISLFFFSTFRCSVIELPAVPFLPGRPVFSRRSP